MNLDGSGNPLIKKLGIPEAEISVCLHVPDVFWELVFPIPELLVTDLPQPAENLGYVHAFYTEFSQFCAEFPGLKQAIRKNGSIWISWPKKSAKTGCDINETIIRDFGLSCGLVDVKVCSIDATWSGLKFMYRRTDR
jgi:hypothetical protein